MIDTKKFIDTLNSILNINLWPSVNNAISSYDMFYRDTMKLVDLEFDDLTQSISKYLENKQGEKDKLGNKEGDIWYIIETNTEPRLSKPTNMSYRIGYWDGEPVDEGSDDADTQSGFSFDLNLHCPSEWNSKYLYLNINHQYAWLEMGGGANAMLYTFDPDIIRNHLINWPLRNPMEVKE